MSEPSEKGKRLINGLAVAARGYECHIHGEREVFDAHLANYGNATDLLKLYVARLEAVVAAARPLHHAHAEPFIPGCRGCELTAALAKLDGNPG